MKYFGWKFLLAGSAMILAAGAALALKPSLGASGHGGLRPRRNHPALVRQLDSSTEHRSDCSGPDVQAKLDRLYSQVVSRNLRRCPAASA